MRALTCNTGTARRGRFGSIVERNLNESGEVLDEAVVGDASDAGSEEENVNEG